MPNYGVYYIDSVAGTHFTGALAQNAIESESIDFPDLLGSVGVHDVIIEGVTVQSDQNLEWDVFIWSKNTYNTTNLDTAELVDYFNFPAANGKQIAGANQYYYPLPANEVSVPYRDEDNTGKLHISLVNRSATSKNAGATGEVTIRVIVRPIFGRT